MKLFSRVALQLALLLFPLLYACNTTEEIEVKESTRTVLVYMAADNSLSTYAYADLADMVAGVGTYGTNGGELLVYLDSRTDAPILYKIQRNSKGEGVKQEVKRYEEHNSADYRVMQMVFSDVFASHPADSYGLILWSHGFGWIPANSTYMNRTASLFSSEYGRNHFPTKWFGQDLTPVGYMDLAELKEALVAVPHLSFLAFDACFMASLEVVDQLKDQADFIMAAPTEIHAAGYPYSDLLVPMFRATSPDLLKMCQLFHDFYQGYNVGINPLFQTSTISLVNCSEVAPLSTMVRAWLLKYQSKIATLDIATLQHFDRVPEIALNAAMFDLEEYLSALLTEEEMGILNGQLSKTVVANYYTPSFINLPIATCSGLSFYIPQSRFPDLNSAHRALGWGE